MAADGGHLPPQKEDDTVSDQLEPADAARDATTADEPPRARPRYGEYAPPPPPRFGEFATPEEQRASVAERSAPPVDVPSEVRKPRTADIASTCVLLFAGLIGCSFGIASVVGLPDYIQSEYALRSLGVYTPPAALGTITTAIAASHIVLFVLALAISTRLMMRRRLAFYVPLVAGILAAAIFWTLLVSFIVSDQQLLTTITQSTR
jgi:hypothetical protein